MTETVIRDAAVWRANAHCEGARVQNSIFDATIELVFGRIGLKYWGGENITNSGPAITAKEIVRITPETITKFIDDAVKDIPDPEVKQQTIDQMKRGLVGYAGEDDTTKIENEWRACEDASRKFPQAEFDKKHAAFLRDFVCDAKESPAAVAKGIIRNWISDSQDRRDFTAQLARGLLGEDGKPCAATEDLDEADKDKLRVVLANLAATPAPVHTP